MERFLEDCSQIQIYWQYKTMMFDVAFIYLLSMLSTETQSTELLTCSVHVVYPWASQHTQWTLLWLLCLGDWPQAWL